MARQNRFEVSEIKEEEKPVNTWGDEEPILKMKDGTGTTFLYKGQVHELRKKLDDFLED
ncbi:MAG: hypothetical protein ABEK16_04620 [Candidatus Nanohalobium sp.]